MFVLQQDSDGDIPRISLGGKTTPGGALLASSADMKDAACGESTADGAIVETVFSVTEMTGCKRVEVMEDARDTLTCFWIV